MILGFIGVNNTTLSVIGIWCLLGLGIGFVETIAYDLIISAVPVDKSGAASGIAESVYELGMALGAAVIGSVMSWGYRAHLVIPNGVNTSNTKNTIITK